MVTASRFSFLGQCRGSYVRRKKCGGKWYPDKKKKKRNNTQYRGGANRYAAHPTYQRERVLMAVIYLFCGCDQGEIFSNVFVLSDENRRRWQMTKTKASDAVRSCKGSRSGLEPKKGALESFGTANIAFNCERYRCAKFCLISPVTSVFFFDTDQVVLLTPFMLTVLNVKIIDWVIVVLLLHTTHGRITSMGREEICVMAKCFFWKIFWIQARV